MAPPIDTVNRASLAHLPKSSTAAAAGECIHCPFVYNDVNIYNFVERCISCFTSRYNKDCDMLDGNVNESG